MSDVIDAHEGEVQALDHSAEHGDGGSANAEGGEPTVEDRARLSGWKPKEEFQGDPNRWRPAQEFLDISDRSAPIATERLRKLESEVVRMNRMHEQAIERARQQERAAVRAEMARAVTEGDGERVMQLADRLETTAQPQPDTSGDVRDFQTRNPWFGQDPVLTAQATRISNETRQHYPNLSVADELKVVEAEMSRLYPEKLTIKPNSRRPAMPSSEMGGVRLAPRGASAFDRLPHAAKQQFETYKRQKLYTDADREAFAADYDAPSFTIERKAKVPGR